MKVVSDGADHFLLQYPLVGSYPSEVVQQFDVHPGGRLLVAGGSQIVIWDLVHRRIVATTQGPFSGLARFDHTGRSLLTFSRNSIFRSPIRRTETDDEILWDRIRVTTGILLCATNSGGLSVEILSHGSFSDFVLAC